MNNIITIPQTRPLWPVRIIRRTMRGVYWFNLQASRLIWQLQGHRPFRLAGHCQGCGACCEHPSIQVGRFLWYWPTPRRLFLWYQARINGFDYEERIISERVFVFKCRQFDPQTRRCRQYADRPGMCRDYPRLLLWQPHPQFLAGCGYRPVARNADRLLDALKSEGLSEEAMEKIKRNLHLEE